MYIENSKIFNWNLNNGPWIGLIGMLITVKDKMLL